jgi:hypothetical protein
MSLRGSREYEWRMNVLNEMISLSQSRTIEAEAKYLSTWVVPPSSRCALSLSPTRVMTHFFTDGNMLNFRNVTIALFFIALAISISPAYGTGGWQHQSSSYSAQSREQKSTHSSSHTASASKVVDGATFHYKYDNGAWQQEVTSRVSAFVFGFFLRRVIAIRCPAVAASTGAL